MDHLRLTQALKDNKWDAIVPVSAESVFYLSGSPTALRFRNTQQTRSNTMRAVFVVHPLEGEPALIVPMLDRTVNQEEARVKDLRMYETYSASPVDALAETIRDKGLAGARIGLEIAALMVPQYRRLVELLPGAVFEDCTAALADVRSVKTPDEIAILREGVALMHGAILDGFAAAKAGDSELGLHRRIMGTLVAQGFQPSEVSWTLTGQRSRVVHRLPSEARKLEVGEVVRTDFVAAYRNYIVNLSRMAFVGRCSPEQRGMHGTLLEIYGKMAASMRPGTRACDVYQGYVDILKDRGITSPFPYAGHGIGLDVDDVPMINATDTTKLKNNMVIVVGPVLPPDYHMQDPVVVTAKGGVPLASLPRFDELPIIGG